MIILAIAAILELGIIIFLILLLRKFIIHMGKMEKAKVKEYQRRNWQQRRIETLVAAIKIFADADESPKLGYFPTMDESLFK